MAQTKYIYLFTEKENEGRKEQVNLLGGKGANLAEMISIGLPVPPGFTITTEGCVYYMKNHQQFPPGMKEGVLDALKKVEAQMGKKFGDSVEPLLVSVRSGARKSMPGMMETVLNVGLNDVTAKAMIAKTNNPRFVYDSQRRLIQMYSDVVMEKGQEIEPAEGMGVREQLEKELHKMKKARGVQHDHQLTADDLKELIAIYKAKVQEVLGKPFPEDPLEQLWGGIQAVFQSWNGRRAIAYRNIEGIPHEWGTAVNVQSMVFGNVGDSSATGVAFTRNPATGENNFYGEWLANAQGEDVVAGIRTPCPVNEVCRTPQYGDNISLEQFSLPLYKELYDIRMKLEAHYHDMLDIEFTIQEGKLWMLQCRVGKRNGVAAVRMAVEMVGEGMIDSRTAVTRVEPRQLDELLHPVVDPVQEKMHKVIAKGLPAGPGGAKGKAVFTANAAIEWAERKEQVILIREETNPEDVAGMRAAQAILTARGGMTSHAALVARGWGKCCIVGAEGVEVYPHEKYMKCGDTIIKEGEWLTLNGTKGYAYAGELPLQEVSMGSAVLSTFLGFCSEHTCLHVHANADTPKDAAKALQFGATGIGLLRTEHMFYGDGGEEPLYHMRRMILASDAPARKAALDDMFPYMKDSFKGTLKAMAGFPVTIRLLDPPLHEFVPQSQAQREKLAARMGITVEKIAEAADRLHESNPMMGHRGCRVGISYPEVTAVQTSAILEAMWELKNEGIEAKPEIMVPLTAMSEEWIHQRDLVNKIKADFKAAGKEAGEVPVGTMIETPRGALVSGKIAALDCDFFSFGTNDLTQMTYGFSRDDIQSFFPEYEKCKLATENPFAVLDQEGVGELVKMAVVRGRQSNPKLHIGICGEHGGENLKVADVLRDGVADDQRVQRLRHVRGVDAVVVGHGAVPRLDLVHHFG